MNSRSIATGVGLGRVLFGVICLIAPKLLLRSSGSEPRGSAVWMIRAFGVRDVVLGGGALSALARGRDARSWVAAGAVADTGDVLNAIAFRDELGGAGLVATLGLAVPASAGGWYAAATLDEG